MHPGTHPMLRPGVRVCLRGEGLLQVGLDPRWSVRATDTPQIRSLLKGLRHGAEPPRLTDLDPRTARCYLDLLERGLIIDGSDYLATVTSTAQPAHRRFLAADAAEHGSLAHRRARRALRIAVHDRGLGADSALDLLAAAGFTAAPYTPAAPPAAGRPRTSDEDASTEPPSLVLLLDPDQGDRGITDDLLARDVPHLPISCAEGILRVGPFVVPGESGCVRCVDAGYAQSDPRRPLLVEQYAASAPDWECAVPLDLLQVAIGAAVRDISVWADGGRPTTWSTVVEIDSDLTLPRQLCPPHPECGCCWDLFYGARAWG